MAGTKNNILDHGSSSSYARNGNGYQKNGGSVNISAATGGGVHHHHDHFDDDHDDNQYNVNHNNTTKTTNHHLASVAHYNAIVEIQQLNKDGTSNLDIPKVFFKRDGSRFKHEHTLKLLVDTYYQFQVTIRPSMPLHSVTIQGQLLTTFEAQPSDSIYKFKWDTLNEEPKKRRKRSNISIGLNFQGNLSMVIPLQVKYYKLDKQKHLCWGNVLHFIEYEFKQKKNCPMELDVVDIVFR